MKLKEILQKHGGYTSLREENDNFETDLEQWAKEVYQQGLRDGVEWEHKVMQGRIQGENRMLSVACDTLFEQNKDKFI